MRRVMVYGELHKRSPIVEPPPEEGRPERSWFMGQKEHSSKGHVFYLDDLTLSAYNRPLNGAVHA